MELREINLSVSNICNANCIYCPRSFVVHDKKYMPVELVEKIMNEVGSNEFKSYHSVVHCVPSENGEAFLHPDILDILRIIRKNNLGISLFSNFSLIDNDIAWMLIVENLVDVIHVNLDGATEETYKAVKGINLQIVEKNLINFLEIRNTLHSNIRIFGHIITYYNYFNAVNKYYGIPPIKSNGGVYKQDSAEALLKYTKILNTDLDNIGIDSVALWVERYNNKPKVGDFKCPNLDRIKHCAYINPEGNWYACCFDIGNNLIFGNIYESSIREIAESKKRKDFINLLESREFDKIGFPCNRVDACQGVNVS